MPVAMHNIIFWGAISCLFAVLLFFGINFGIYEPPQLGTGISPRAYPRAVVLLLLCTSLYLTVDSFLQYKRAQAQGKKPDKTDNGEPLPTLKLILACVIILAYSLGISTLGIALASTLAFALLIRLNGEQRTLFMLGVGATLSVGLYYFFLYVAFVPMPPGPFGGVI